MSLIAINILNNHVTIPLKYAHKTPSIIRMLSNRVSFSKTTQIDKKRGLNSHGTGGSEIKLFLIRAKP